MSTGTTPPLAQWKRWQPTPPVAAAWGVVLIGFLWTYRETLAHVVHVWWTTPDYGHGFFVPIFAGYLLWHRQEMVDPWPTKGSWWGMAFFALFLLIRWFNLFLNYERDIDSLLPFLFGMTLILGGWRAFLWAWPSILFLIFMVPLPESVASALGGKLQHLATIMSQYMLQTVGIPAISAEGSNIIDLPTSPKLNIESACSGLKMMTVFFAICVGVSFVIKEPWWKKLILVVSAVPIAIISNVLRIVLTGMLQEWVSVDVGHFIHDWAGWWMMIPAMLMIWGEMSLLSALIIETQTEGPLSFGGGGGSPRRRNTLVGPGGLGRPDGPRGTTRL